jgi:hypothetical protein
MRENKQFASLSSGLLARKGTAKPAMRPQGFGSFGANLEDLGWNDMGQAEEVEPMPHHVPSPVSALTPSIARPAPEPAVVVHQRALEESFAPTSFERECSDQESTGSVIPAVREVHQSASVVTLPRRRGEIKTGKAKAAFTLRLEPDRHLKLRLACALTRRSAQQLVTEALDTFLNTLPEVEAMAEHLPAETGTRGR